MGWPDGAEVGSGTYNFVLKDDLQRLRIRILAASLNLNNSNLAYA